MKIVSKEEAFKPLPHEVSIPLAEIPDHRFQFTRSWFVQRNQATWSTFIKPKFDTGLLVRVIQIGVFEGRDLSWLLQHVLKNHFSKAWAIDPWLPTTKLNAEYMQGVEQRARHNLSRWENKVTIIKGKSQDINLAETVDQPVDLCIIDGDHNEEPVKQDAINCYQALKVGGWMVFDDVRNRVDKKHHVQDGIRLFLQEELNGCPYDSLMEHLWSHRYCDCYVKLR